jgi:hypothetical protein
VPSVQRFTLLRCYGKNLHQNYPEGILEDSPGLAAFRGLPWG